MSETWIVNASPIISLARAGRVELLTALCPELIVPAAVVEEILRGRESDAARNWLLSNPRPKIYTPIDPRIAALDLGDGEASVLGLALETSGATAILDDRAARNCAISLGIPVRGTVGIVLLAKQTHLIPNVAPVFEELIKAGMRIDRATVRRALFHASESS